MKYATFQKESQGRSYPVGEQRWSPQDDKVKDHRQQFRGPEEAYHEEEREDSSTYSQHPPPAKRNPPPHHCQRSEDKTTGRYSVTIQAAIC